MSQPFQSSQLFPPTSGASSSSTTVIDVTAAPYNAVGDGATDDTVHIQAAINAASAQGGGIVFFPARTFVCASSLALDNTHGVWLRGTTQAKETVAESSVLKYTGTGTSFITGAGASGPRISNLYIYSSNASFSGTLLNFDSPSTNAWSGIIENCTIGANSDTSGVLIAIDGTGQFRIRDNNILGGVIQLRGKVTVGAQVCAVSGNQFKSYTTAAIQDPHQAWTISGNNFEPGSGSIQKAVKTTIFASQSAVKFDNNWIGDSTSSNQVFVELGGAGITITNNRVGAVSGSTNTGFKLTNAIGCYISGNAISTNPQVAFDFNGGVGSLTTAIVVESNLIDSAIAVTSVTSVTTTATVTTTVAHGLATGYVVTISGASPSAYNGIYAITVTGATTFTYTFAGGTSPATGTILVRAGLVNLPAAANYRISHNASSTGVTVLLAYPQEFVGFGSPEGAVTAQIGSTFRRTDGVGTSLYVKESGAQATGWLGK